ncbi:MAG TPA: response regulator transcription factor [Thermoanaerobaculia bacterium]|nr:response regulator transcription factor [Thermoanaerobaculia bacterium]
MRVLVVEDDLHMASLLGRVLRESGYAVDLVGDGTAAVERASATDYDLVILDILLPGLDGFGVCRRLRAAGSSTPILMLSARSEIADRVRGLEIGADDYLPKPFAVGELRARVGALLRRRALPPQMMLTVGNIRLDRAKRLVDVENRMVELTAKEYALLEYLLLNRGRTVPRREIAEHVWADSFDPTSNLIDVYISRLRQKLDPASDRGVSFLTTRRGEGYFVADDAERPA